MSPRLASIAGIDVPGLAAAYGLAFCADGDAALANAAARARDFSAASFPLRP